MTITSAPAGARCSQSVESSSKELKPQRAAIAVYQVSKSRYGRGRPKPPQSNPSAYDNKNIEHTALFGVYYSMTNGGIIEGQMGVNPCSDLSFATYFGSGETRSNKRMFCKLRDSVQVRGDLHGERHLAPDNFIMKYLSTIILLVFHSCCYGFDSELNAKIIANYQRSNAELEESINRKNMEYEMGRQTRELQEQTRLLRKIAND